ncbi:MAG: hypothetical protein IAC69_01285 [Proteobacteria bacterium]|uniref:Uncharacterized protein n=1 Tax=Candidatus Enterousia avistercoris TaxID=2840788 RepID=A0A9D9GVC1_9PROT|nr:hypothetical protein [Candidatus Enterousia avistercoris]
MIKSKGIFAVSFIAMMVVGGAYANIASQGYVDQQIDTRAPAGDYATKTELNAKQNASTAVEVATAGTAVGDATHPIYVNASGVATKIDKVAAAETADTATSATSATKATQDASGNVITTTYATKTELNAKADADDIPTVNNATLTIQKNGAAVATFTANSATAATANITVPTKTSELTNDSGFITSAALPEEYTLPAATAAALGGVKSGGDITVAADGAVTVNSATTADSATKATQDASGRVIADTYATKAEIPDEITVDATLSADSTNPVQNKVVKAALDKKLENTATGTGSLSTGGATPATADSTVVIGDAASGSVASVVVGQSAKSSETGFMNVAVGMNASANEEEAVAIGSNANVAGQGVAIGANAKSTVEYGTAVGYRAETGAGSAIAIGQNAKSTALGAIQLGTGTNSTAGTFNVGFGTDKIYQLLDNDGKIPDERMPDTVLTNTATGVGGFATGGGNAGDYTSATIIGTNAVTTGPGGTVYGARATATRSGTAIGASASVVQSAVALGANAKGEGLNSVALGMGSAVSGENSIGIGKGAFARGTNNVVVGNEAGAGGNNSISLGFGASTNTENAIQIGTGTNLDPGTLSVGFGDSGNYKLLDSSGKIPGERLQISVGSATDPTGYADIWIE